MPPLTHIFANCAGGIVGTWSLQLKWLRLRKNIEMLCAKNIADLCRSRAALK